MREPPAAEVTEEILNGVARGRHRPPRRARRDAHRRCGAGRAEGKDRRPGRRARTTRHELRGRFRGLAEARTPRGIFFFCGPTGVGKTETALALSKILGGEGVARASRLQHASGREYQDPGEVINSGSWAWLPAISGTRSEGGMLSKVRDSPESIVLFDEIEKAHPGVGGSSCRSSTTVRYSTATRTSLTSDARSSSSPRTPAAGTSRRSRSASDTEVDSAGGETPKVSVNDVQEELRQLGFGEEFLGRNIDYILFAALDREQIEVDSTAPARAAR